MTPKLKTNMPTKKVNTGSEIKSPGMSEPITVEMEVVGQVGVTFLCTGQGLRVGERMGSQEERHLEGRQRSACWVSKEDSADLEVMVLWAVGIQKLLQFGSGDTEIRLGLQEGKSEGFMGQRYL